MEKKILLFLALLIFSFHYCANSILIYKSELKEVKVNTRLVNKTFDNKVYTIKVSVGENFLGKITSVNLEVMNDNDNKLYNTLSSNKEKMNEKIKNFISSINSPKGIGMTDSISPTSSTGSCLSTCNKKWDCYNQPTNAGVLLCASDCIIECAS